MSAPVVGVDRDDITTRTVTAVLDSCRVRPGQTPPSFDWTWGAVRDGGDCASVSDTTNFPTWLSIRCR